MNDLFRLDGKTVLVTGASSGLGAHFALVLAGAGADVVLAARRVDKLEQTANRVRELGRQAWVVAMDVADTGSVAEAFRGMPPLDVVINNAGITRVAPVDQQTEEDWDAVMDTNLKGVWAVSREAIRRWRESGRAGNVINIASILGLRVQNHIPSYVASKAAVVQLTKSIALDYARYNIRCNALCPGYFPTDINRDFFETEHGQQMLKRIPYRRVGELHELDGPLLLLASDASQYMTGATVPVDGGHLCNSL